MTASTVQTKNECWSRYVGNAERAPVDECVKEARAWWTAKGQGGPVSAPPPRYNQHSTSSLKGMYLGLLLRALTGGLNVALPEPFVGQWGHRGNGGCNGESCLLKWDGHQRAIETGRVLEQVLDSGVQGAIAEVGVYKGGMAAYLQGILLARYLTGEDRGSLRNLWLVDSFQGLPPTDGMQSQNTDAGGFNSDADQAKWAGRLAVDDARVLANLERHKLLAHGNVKVLKGYVNESLPRWPRNQRLALLRIDVDIYSATYDALHYLYPVLREGGAVLFDDFKFNYSAAAIHDYRSRHGITNKLRFLPGTVDPMAYWIK